MLSRASVPGPLDGDLYRRRWPRVLCGGRGYKKRALQLRATAANTAMAALRLGGASHGASGSHSSLMRRAKAMRRALCLALCAVAAAQQTVADSAPPVFGAYPTGGPVLGGTTVTIVGHEFGRINTVGLNRVRCSWGDPRPWQQSVFAAQQAEMDGWSPAESVLPPVPSTYFTRATRLYA